MRYAAVIVFLLCSLPSVAQQPASSRADLERRRQSIIESIRQSQAQLAETKANKNATLAELRALQAKLDARMRLIGNINQEISAISGDIQHSSKEVSQLQQNLESLKARYAQSVRYSYQSRSSRNMLAFLFSAANYDDAVRRMKYLKRYRDYRKQQAEAIRSTQGRIENKIAQLNTQKNQQSVLLSAEEQQRKVLQSETNETNNVVKQLKGRERELLVDIEENKKAAKKVEKAVQALIAREIEEQRKRAELEAKKRAAEELRRKQEEERKIAAAKAAAAASGNNGVSVNTGSGMRGTSGTPTNTNPATGSTPSTSANTRPATGNSAPIASNTAPVKPKATPREIFLTPDAQALSNSFEANRGRLPWPVERGVITGYFGPHKHPVAQVIEDNDGIDIQTSTGASARAVFEGTVTSVFDVPGRGVNILIVHGQYFTVYTNLASASVSKGQKVSTKQQIGTVGLNTEGLPTIGFQIWKALTKGSSKLNPSQWIAN